MIPKILAEIVVLMKFKVTTQIPVRTTKVDTHKIYFLVCVFPNVIICLSLKVLCLFAFYTKLEVLIFTTHALQLECGKLYSFREGRGACF